MNDLVTQTLVIDPFPKPRMVKSDAWNGRGCVIKYWAFKDALNELWGEKELPEQLGLIFTIPMPIRWTDKKKNIMNGRPHQQRPDVDNMVKSVLDCLAENDSYIWQVNAVKIWGVTGSIQIQDLTKAK